MAHFEQWAGFKGKEWVNSVDVRSFIQENYTPYEETNLSWKDQQKQQIFCGVNFRNFRKRSVQKAAFLIWRQK